MKQGCRRCKIWGGESAKSISTQTTRVLFTTLANTSFPENVEIDDDSSEQTEIQIKELRKM
jgi:hypothetical protein